MTDFYYVPQYKSIVNAKGQFSASNLGEKIQKITQGKHKFQNNWVKHFQMTKDVLQVIQKDIFCVTSLKMLCVNNTVKLH